jgi:nucleotide-binding universal stress UspA family protein
MRDEANLIVERAGQELKQQGVSSRPVIREGLPEVQILSEADVGQYDLIVLGATGRSDLTHVTAGSVAIRVAEYAPANVWVVR